MAVRLTLDLPEEVFSTLRTHPDEFGREMRVAAAVKWYERGMLSQSKAAEVAGLSRHGFLEALARYQVTPFQVTPEELEAELERG